MEVNAKDNAETRGSQRTETAIMAMTKQEQARSDMVALRQIWPPLAMKFRSFQTQTAFRRQCKVLLQRQRQQSVSMSSRTCNLRLHLGQSRRFALRVVGEQKSLLQRSQHGTV